MPAIRHPKGSGWSGRSPERSDPTPGQHDRSGGGARIQTSRIDLHEREQQSKRRRRRGAVARQAETKPQAQQRAPEPVPASADPAAAAVSGDALAKEHHMVGGGRWQRRRCPRRGACEHGKTLGIVTKCCRPLAAGPSRAARAAASEARAPARPRRTGPVLRAAASARHRFAATTLAALRRAFVIGARCGARKLGRARGR